MIVPLRFAFPSFSPLAVRNCVRFAIAVTLVATVDFSLAADHRAEPLAEGPPPEVAAAIAKQLNESGVRVVRGTSRTVCDIWLARQWPLASVKPAQGVSYPFKPGQLVGVVRYPRKGADFREQDIPAGVYTLRYAQQPVDGAHIGTSPTRDFLLLVQADKDAQSEPLDYKTLTGQSKAAVETAHPGLLSLQPVKGDGAIRHEEDSDWWIVRLVGKASVDGQTQPLKLDLVAVGYAAE